MSDLDFEGLARLLPYVNRALAEMPTHQADQLSTAMREGRTSLRFEPSAVGAVVVVSIAGTEVCEVDLRNIVDPDSGAGWVP